MNDEHELIVRIEDHERVRAVGSGGGETFGVIEPDDLRTRLIALFDNWAREGKLTERREFELFGALLWRSLLPQEVASFLDARLAEARTDDRRLRIQLTFAEGVGGLASLPWEYLYRPDTPTRRGFFLGTAPDIVLSRYLPLEVDREDLAPKQGPLRLLT